MPHYPVTPARARRRRPIREAKKTSVARVGCSPAFRGHGPLVLSYATTAPEIAQCKENWSGWQGVESAWTCAKTCGWPLPYILVVGRRFERPDPDSKSRVLPLD